MAETESFPNDPADEDAAAERRKRNRTVVGAAMLMGGFIILAVAFVVHREMRTPEPSPADATVPVVAGETPPPADAGVPLPAVVLICAGMLEILFGMAVLAFGLPGDWRAHRERIGRPDFNPYNRR